MSASDPSDDSYLHKNAVDSYSSEISYPAPDKKLISLGDSLQWKSGKDKPSVLKDKKIDLSHQDIISKSNSLHHTSYEYDS